MRISSSRIMETIVEDVSDIKSIKIGSQMSRKPTVMQDLEYPWKHSPIFLNLSETI